MSPKRELSSVFKALLPFNRLQTVLWVARNDRRSGRVGKYICFLSRHDGGRPSHHVTGLWCICVDWYTQWSMLPSVRRIWGMRSAPYSAMCNVVQKHLWKGIEIALTSRGAGCHFIPCVTGFHLSWGALWVWGQGLQSRNFLWGKNNYLSFVRIVFLFFALIWKVSYSNENLYLERAKNWNGTWCSKLSIFVIILCSKSNRKIKT